MKKRARSSVSLKTVSLADLLSVLQARRRQEAKKLPGLTRLQRNLEARVSEVHAQIREIETTLRAIPTARASGGMTRRTQTAKKPKAKRSLGKKIEQKAGRRTSNRDLAAEILATE